MNENKVLRPPYASSGMADQLLDIFQRIAPKKIDVKYITQNHITTAPNASKAMDFVKWMRIIDVDGSVKEEVSNKLRLVGEEREKYIKELIVKSYKALFDSLNLEQAKKDDIINYFVNTHSFGRAQAQAAAALFLHLCHRAKIPVSDELKKKTHTGSTISKKPRQDKAKIEIKKNDFAEQEGKQTDIEQGTIVLRIVGNGLDRKLIAHSKEELQEIYETKFKALIEAAKILFLEENSQNDNHVTKSDEELEPD